MRHSLVPSLLPITCAVRHYSLTRRKTYKTKRKTSWLKGSGGERRPGCCQKEAAVRQGRQNWIHRSARSVTDRHHQHLFLVVGVLVDTYGAIIWKVANGTNESLYVAHCRRLEHYSFIFFYINILMKWKYQRKRLRNASGTQCFSLFASWRHTSVLTCGGQWNTQSTCFTFFLVRPSLAGKKTLLSYWPKTFSKPQSCC